MPADAMTFAGSRSGPQFGQRNPRRKPTSLLKEEQYDINRLASFKISPSYRPDDFRNHRPYMGQCCNCIPVSRDNLHESSHEEYGMRNILDAKQQLKSENVWATFFSKVVYTMRRPLFGAFPDLSMAVLTNRRVVEAVQKTARELGAKHKVTDSHAVEKRAENIMNKMKASISPVFVKFTGWFLLKFLSVMHRGVQVHRGQMATLKKASEKGLPMIYLPLHKSHLDYILITFILWNYDIRTPHVAAGDNMDIPFFSRLMRSLGGFFIRRRLDNGGDQKDHVYRAILNTYMLELLKKGESLEFFIEGGRTRTGRAVIPKGGLLSVVAEACTEDIIYDAYIVPVTFSYDRLVEGSFNKEQMGEQKMKESFLGACKAIFGILTGDFGNVRVNFAQPFSLREFLQSAETFPPPAQSYINSPTSGSMSGLNLCQQAMSMVLNSMTTESQYRNHSIVRALAHHTVCTSVATHTPMSTHCLAFLFLTKYRQGGTLAALGQDMDWLKMELRYRKFDVGYTGAGDKAVLYAFGLLGEEAITQSVSEDGDMMLLPNLDIPEVFTLAYSANSLTATFALESIVVSAVVLEGKLMPSLWGNSQQQGTEQPTVIRENVLTTAQHICDLLHLEFILVPPCKLLEDALLDEVENLIGSEILVSEELQYDGMVDLAERQWARRVAESLAWDDDEDDDIEEGGYVEQQSLKVNLNIPDICRKIQFLHSVLAPILESYLITAFYIDQSLKEDMPEDDFMKKLGDFARKRARDQLVMYIESCGFMTLKNAVKAFQQLNILETYKAANLTMITLAEQIGVHERLHQYIEILKVARS